MVLREARSWRFLVSRPIQRLDPLVEVITGHSDSLRNFSRGLGNASSTASITRLVAAVESGH